MTVNIGSVDRWVRVIVGLALIALAATGTTGAWAYLGIVPLATGLMRFCSVYGLFGMNICAKKSA